MTVFSITFSYRKHYLVGERGGGRDLPNLLSQQVFDSLLGACHCAGFFFLLFTFFTWQTHLSWELQLQYCLLSELSFTLSVICSFFNSFIAFCLSYICNNICHVSPSDWTLSVGLIPPCSPFWPLSSTRSSWRRGVPQQMLVGWVLARWTVTDGFFRSMKLGTLLPTVKEWEASAATKDN